MTGTVNFTVPYVEGDGVGPELINYVRQVVDSVLEICYGQTKQINWLQIHCGEKAAELYQGDWFPEQTLNTIEQYGCALIGPITAPIGYGFKSLNVALRHELGLNCSYTRFTLANNAQLKVMRDNSEDLPIGLEWQTDSTDGQLLAEFFKNELGVNKVPFETTSTMALKYLSQSKVQALFDTALRHAKACNINQITIVHQAHNQPLSEGSFVRWCLAHMANKYAVEQHGNQAIKVQEITIKISSLLQFFASNHKVESDTLFIAGNHLASILNDFYTGTNDLINKVSQTNFGNDVAIFEPKHGPLHSLVGQDNITPVALLNAAICLLQHLGCKEAANFLNCALQRTELGLKESTLSFKHFQKELAQQLGGKL